MLKVYNNFMSYEENKRIKELQEYVSELMIGDNKKQLYEKYREVINNVVPMDVIKIEYNFLSSGLSATKLLENVDMLMNVFHKGLSAYTWEKPIIDSFLYYLMEENKQIVFTLNNLKKYISSQTFEENRSDILLFIEDINSFDCHYQKIVNIIFPTMQKKLIEFNGLAIMWELHLTVRKTLKSLKTHFSEKIIDIKKINKLIGKLFFQLHGLIKKEELILYPLVLTMLNDNECQIMLEQSFDYNYYNIEINKPLISFSRTDETLSMSQAEILFNHLPFDITFIDEFDKVSYFNQAKNRIFPRSSSVIGRDVRQCHPPKSVHIVEKILEHFKEGKENKAVFWINLKGEKILISYYAIRDEEKNYKGILEVVQDITNIQNLNGEKRLLDW